MKYITALLSSLFIFVCVEFLSITLLVFICPKSWFWFELKLGMLSANIPFVIATVIASVIATHTFHASLHSKRFKLYKRKGNEKRK